MSGELTASFILRFNDQASANAGRALRTLKQEMSATSAEGRRMSASATDAASRVTYLGHRFSATATEGRKAGQAAAEAAAKLQQLGNVRLNSQTPDWMRLVEQNSARAARSVGLLEKSLQAAGRVASATGKGLQVYAQGVGAVQAAKFVLADPVRQTMNYSGELAHVSNTLYANESVEKRIGAKKEINDAVMAAIRAGGGSREGALEGLKTMAASGEFGSDPKAAYAALPAVVKAASATGSTTTDMVNLAIKAKQNMGLTDYERVFGMAAKGGDEGQFELRDMAKWLPQQMAYAKRTGLRGEEGFATLVAANQLAMTTAGSTDEAGNNVKNLLAKVNSSDTAADAKKLGIDLSGTLAAAQSKGTGGLDAFMNLTEQVAAKDARLVKLREQAKTAKGDDLKANLQAQAGILEGSSIGKLVQDQQAMSALVALLNGRQRFDDIRGKALGEKNTIGSKYEVVSAEAGHKMEKAAAEKANAMYEALGKVNPLLGAAADGFSALAQEFPGATAAVLGLGTAANAAAAALITLAGIRLLTDKNKLPGMDKLPDGLKKILGPASASRLATGGGAVAAALAPLGVMAGVTQWAGDTSHDKERSESLLGLSGFLAKFLPDSTKAARERYEAQRAELNADAPPQQIAVTVNLDGRQIAEAVNEVNGHQARRN